MKTTILIPLLVCGFAMVAGCSDTKDTPDVLPPDGTQFSETFVQQYLMPAAIGLTEIRLTSANPSVRCIHIAFDGEAYNPGNEQFKALSVAYGDTSFNDYIIPYSNLALSEAIETVTVQWTATGATEPRSLDSKTRIETATPYEFIRNGYRHEEVELPEEHTIMGENRQYGYRTVCKPLDDLTADDPTLIDYKRCYLILPAGELSEGGTLNVVLTFGEQTRSATLDIAPIQ